MLSRNRFCPLDGKIRDKSPDHLFDLNVYDSMLRTIIFQASILSFLIWVAEVRRKNSSLCCSVFLSFCPCLSFCSFANLKLAFSLQKHLGRQEKHSPSRKSLFAVEEYYFSRALTSLISLQWVMYEGSFQVCDGRWWKKILECQKLKLGDSPGTPKKYSRRLKRLSLGVPPCIPFFINNHQLVPRYTIFLSLHALCAVLGASLLLV